jgi:hypothetical protein
MDHEYISVWEIHVPKEPRGVPVVFDRDAHAWRRITDVLTNEERWMNVDGDIWAWEPLVKNRGPLTDKPL